METAQVHLSLLCQNATLMKNMCHGSIVCANDPSFTHTLNVNMCSNYLVGKDVHFLSESSFTSILQVDHYFNTDVRTAT